MLKAQYVKGFKNNSYLQGIINLEAQLFTSTFKQIYRIDPEIQYWVMINEMTNQVVGYLSYKQTDVSYDVIQIGVDPNYRRQNIAYNLMQKIMDHDVILEVNVNNTAAISLYEKLGFKTITTLPNYYQGSDGIRMIYQHTN